MKGNSAPWCHNTRIWLDFKSAVPNTCPHPESFYQRGCEDCGYYEEREATRYYKRKIKILRAGRDALEEVE